MADVAGDFIQLEASSSSAGLVLAAGFEPLFRATLSANLIEILLVSPASGAEIGALTPLSFNIRSRVELRRLVIVFAFAGRHGRELAYAENPATAAPFETPYTASAVAPVVDTGFFRYAFTLRRAPKWPNAPTMTVFAFDTTGVEL